MSDNIRIGLVDAEFNTILDRVLAKTEELNEEIDIIVDRSRDIDTLLDETLIHTQALMGQVNDLEEERNETEKRVRGTVSTSEQSLKRILSFSRRVAATIRAQLRAQLGAQSEIFAGLIEAALLTAEVLIEVATAESMTLVGAARAGLKLQMAYKLIQKSQAIRAKDEELARRIETQIATISPWTYAIVLNPIQLIYGLIWLLTILECIR